MMRQFSLLPLLLLILFFVGCAGIHLKQPTTEMLMKEAASISGYAIGKSDQGQEMLNYSTDLAKSEVLTLIDYLNWKEYILSLLVADAFLQDRLTTLMSLVDADMEANQLITWGPSETTVYVRRVLRDFISGLKMGLKARGQEYE